MQCSRSGCTKQLRVDNKKGVCSSNCESPDAPPAAQAAGVKRAPSTTSAKKVELPPAREHEAPSDVMSRFRSVTVGLGYDPDKILAEAAQGWLDQVTGLIDQADEEG